MKDKIKNFDYTFYTKISDKIKNKEINMIENIFYSLDEKIYKMSEEEKKLNKRKFDLVDKLYITLNEEQKKYFNEIMDLSSSISAEVDKQLFAAGFCIAKEIEIESKL